MVGLLDRDRPRDAAIPRFADRAGLHRSFAMAANAIDTGRGINHAGSLQWAAGPVALWAH